MRGLLAFYLAIIVLVNPAWAAPTASREALFTRAFQSLPFLMTMASVDVTFRNGLTEKEKQMFQYIDTVAQDARNRQWFIANDVKNYPRDGFDIYFYAPSVGGVNPVAVARAASPIHFGLQFSSDSSLFQLNPGEPERTAMTYPDLSKDIYINLNIINRPGTQVSFAQALGILIHEVGHKLPPLQLEEDAGAINSLAGKIQAFVEAQTTSFKTSTGQIQILRFKNGPFDAWLEENIFGKYQGVNIPFKLEPLRIFDGEGVYVFAKNQNGVFDITTALFSAITGQDILGGERTKDYDWRNINWILASAASVKDIGDGRMKVDINMNHLQTTIPFMYAGAPDPAQYQPYNRSFPNSPPHVGRFERRQWTINLNSSVPKVESELLYPLVFEDPTTEVHKVKVGWEGNDLVAQYLIPKLPEPEWEGGKYLVRPVLIGQLNGATVEILSTKLTAGVDGIFEFRMKGLRVKNRGTLEISGMEMIPRKANLALSTEPHIKVFLPSRDRVMLAGPAVSPSRVLSELSWDGQAWTDLTKAQAAVPASHIRFTLEAATPLASLKILVGYTLKGEIFSDVRFGGQASPERKTGEFTRPVLKWITIEPPAFHQEFKNGKLYVDLEVDKGLLGSLLIQDLIEIPEQDRPGYMPGRGPLIAGRERVKFSAVNADRALHAIEYFTQDLSVGAKTFSAPLKVIKLEATVDPTACQDLLLPKTQP